MTLSIRFLTNVPFKIHLERLFFLFPDCVENICRCDYQEDFPEFKIKLNYEESAEVLHFNWEMKVPEEKDEDFELKYFVVR